MVKHSTVQHSTVQYSTVIRVCSPSLLVVVGCGGCCRCHPCTRRGRGRGRPWLCTRPTLSSPGWRAGHQTQSPRGGLSVVSSSLSSLSSLSLFYLVGRSSRGIFVAKNPGTSRRLLKAPTRNIKAEGESVDLNKWTDLTVTGIWKKPFNVLYTISWVSCLESGLYEMSKVFCWDDRYIKASEFWYK